MRVEALHSFVAAAGVAVCVDRALPRHTEPGSATDLGLAAVGRPKLIIGHRHLDVRRRRLVVEGESAACANICPIGAVF
jgi:hypothetical protein